MQAIILNYLMHRPIKDLTHSHIQQTTPLRRKTLCSTPHTRTHAQNCCTTVCVKGMKYLRNYSLLQAIYRLVKDEVILLLKNSIQFPLVKYWGIKKLSLVSKEEKSARNLNRDIITMIIKSTIILRINLFPLLSDNGKKISRACVGLLSKGKGKCACVSETAAHK